MFVVVYSLPSANPSVRRYKSAGVIGGVVKVACLANVLTSS